MINEKCYLKSKRDCSAKITKEHFLSEGVLRLLDENHIKVRGAPWHEDGEVREYSLARLASKILCKRHNEALSSLDASARAFFGAVREMYDDIADTKTLSRKSIWYLFSGEELELWLVKTAFGLYEAGYLVRDGVPLRDHQLLNPELLDSLTGRPIAPPCGLYVMTTEGKHLGFRNSLDVNVLLSTDEQHMAGLSLAFMGLTFIIALDPRASYARLQSAFKYRPGFLQFRNSKRMHNAVLTWPGGTGLRQKAVLFTKTRLDRL
ncbi:MAG TPA: hypothetical protein VMF32_17215 [Xanthobacteraceae bacterium]|nr:hypothetical protein [Xanthobacteraceae bacterium]